MEYDCMICQNLSTKADQILLISSALYNKYSQSQNYFYISQITNYQEKKPPNLEQDIFNENEERLEKFFPKGQVFQKIKKLTEYYKFHSEVPRYFKKPQQDVLNSFYNQKRKINYFNVKRMMGENPEESVSEEEQGEYKTTFILKDIPSQPKNNSLSSLINLITLTPQQGLSINSSFENTSNQFLEFINKKMRTVPLSEVKNDKKSPIQIELKKFIVAKEKPQNFKLVKGSELKKNIREFQEQYSKNIQFKIKTNQKNQEHLQTFREQSFQKTSAIKKINTQRDGQKSFNMKNQIGTAQVIVKKNVVNYERIEQLKKTYEHFRLDSSKNLTKAIKVEKSINSHRMIKPSTLRIYNQPNGSLNKQIFRRQQII